MSEINKEYYMREALKEAQKAYDLGEVPIGAVVVLDGQIIGRGHNLREQSHDVTSHAEMNAIRQANQALENWRLEKADLYVTVEPCAMCSGAMIWSRLDNLYYGVDDEKSGTVSSLYQLLSDSRFNHQVEVEGGILADECGEIISRFFRELRQKKKEAKAQRKSLEQALLGGE